MAAVGFERHASGAQHTRHRQDRDRDVLWHDAGAMDGHASVTDAEARSGSKSLRVDHDSEVQTRLGAAIDLPEEREHYLSRWLRFEDDFSFDGRSQDGGKLPGPAGAGGTRSGGEPATGDNGFTARYTWREDGRAEFYLYHMDQPTKWGESILFEDPDGGGVFFETGRWHNLVQRVKIDGGGSANGEIDVWLDGERMLDLDGLRMVTNDERIDTAYLSSFHGGGDREWLPQSPQSAFFDEFVISTDPEDFGLL